MRVVLFRKIKFRHSSPWADTYFFVDRSISVGGLLGLYGILRKLLRNDLGVCMRWDMGETGALL